MATSGIAGLTLLLSAFLPTILPGNGWPTAMMAIFGSTLVAELFGLPVARLSVGNGATTKWHEMLPSFTGLPSVGPIGKVLKIVGPAAFSIATISILETLLAVKVVDEMDESEKTPGVENKTCKAMAIGNMVSGLFGGFGGCGMIPQTLLNVQSGGRGVTSVLAYCGVMAMSVLFFSSLINKVPLASLAGVMILVAMKTIRWQQTGTAFSKALKPQEGTQSSALRDLVAVVATSLVCYNVDMGTGIILGVAWTMLSRRSS